MYLLDLNNIELQKNNNIFKTIHAYLIKRNRYAYK